MCNNYYCNYLISSFTHKRRHKGVFDTLKRYCTGKLQERKKPPPPTSPPPQLNKHNAIPSEGAMLLNDPSHRNST